MIRVLVHAPSAAARKRLERLLEKSISASPDLQIVANSPDAGHTAAQQQRDSSLAEDAVHEDDQPDAIVAEFENRFDEGVSELLDDAASGAAVILLVHGAIAEWTDTLRQGIRAVLPANVTAPQLEAAIHAAVAGLVVLHPNEADSVIVTRGSDEFRSPLPEELTQREIEVLRLMAEGFGNKEIAAKLAISEHTAKFHVASILGKLGAASRTEAVTHGIRRGLVLI
jgi:DNA-binding NarL/FixJ family response regulator